MKSENKGNPKAQSGARRVKLPDGSIGVYMGETGSGKNPRQGKQLPPSAQINSQISKEAETGQGPRESRNINTVQNRQNLPPSTQGNVQNRPVSEEARRRAAARARREAQLRRQAETSQNKYVKQILSFILDKVYMRRMSISVEVDDIIRGVIVGALVLAFALLQTTVFAEMSLFGATPDLMLALVIAVAVTEGEKWGAVTGLAAGLLIEYMGSTGAALLPLLYVPCGYAAGILTTYHYKDSVLLRAIFSASSGILRAVFTVIFTLTVFKNPPAGLMFTSIIIPEYFSSLVLSVLPHAAVWLSLKSFHKTRAERVN